MQFSKAQKSLNQPHNYNPPPGYYSSGIATISKSTNSNNFKFAKEQRFGSKQGSTSPGPGAYYNDKAQRVKKRLLEQAKRKEIQYKSSNTGDSEIKISSIPSIPKKSTTRVYQELAPGILILHEEENEGSNLGPGSYNANYEFGQKKQATYKINPQHKKKIEITSQPEVKIPTIAQEIRNQKRQLYKKQIIKSSNVNKNMISPSDLCLEVIILREKLLRAEQNPAPGHYYNQKYQSSFKQADPDLLPQYQLMMGKEERFKDDGQSENIGPGSYAIKSAKQKQGGFIPKQQRQLHQTGNQAKIPGPGAYAVESIAKEPINPKGSYPPIFGSGSNRFYHSTAKTDDTPGPGSYKVDNTRKKKQKYIKIKRQFYQSQIVKHTNDDKRSDIFSLNGDRSRIDESSLAKTHKERSNHYFSSKVQRFKHDKTSQDIIGPGNYEIGNLSLIKKSYNRNQNSYVGSKNARFDETVIRPNLGPGAYYSSGFD